ncbi:MAG TPA: penicillin-insensitive murein endopeptidase [Polyangiaceae bacterium]|nr:penicillin-insensitive murein endopeptidase [Polyangiaceae bacterium]
MLRAGRDLARLACVLPWLLVSCAGAASRGASPVHAPSAAAQPSPADDPNQEAEPAETVAASPEPSPEEPELVEDEGETAGTTEEPSQTRPHPLDGWTQDRIRKVVRSDLASLGSISIGNPNSGALLNGKHAEASELFQLVDEKHAWGSAETIDYLCAAVRKVHERYPGSAPLSLGHVSAERGGPLRPHVSHQSGRDVDISFYYVDGARWYLRATEKNLDLPRTWAFVRALITETDVEMILIDHAVQAWIRRYALEQGEDAAWVDGLFLGKGGLRPIVRHAPGHATHVHVRFYNPIAQETARRAQSALTSEGILPELVSYLRHKARRGDTLAKIAKKYGVSVAAIKDANGLRSSRIREQREYRIPVRSRAPVVAGAPLRFPARRLPPSSASHEPERTSAALFEREAVASAAHPTQAIHAE